MKYLSVLLLSVILLTSCNTETIVNSSDIPSLKISNKAECAQASVVPTISEVILDGYEFKNIAIDVGESEVFHLDKGMPSGYEDILVIVRGPYGATIRFAEAFAVDFRKGATTKIRLINPTCVEKLVILELDK
jgi:hypothetical protein